VNLSTLIGEEKLFLGRLEDLFSGGLRAPRFSSFLTPRQLLIAQAFAQQNRRVEDAMLYGGFSDAVRQVLGVFPQRCSPDAAMFPVQAVTVRYRGSAAPTHRDFLGACLALLITRESIGDIVPDDGRCTIFCLKSVAHVLLYELKKVGSVGVRCEAGAQGEVTLRQEFDPIRGTVSSRRLDCLVSLLTGLAREKSARLIQAEQVSLNHVVAASVSKEFSSGDTVSIWGRGKFIVDKIGEPTKKGRLPVDIRKYG